MRKFNRTIIGAICIAVAIVIAVAVLPMMNRISTPMSEVVRVTANIEPGTKFSGSNVAVTQVPTDGIPDGAITDINVLADKYATATLVVGDFVFDSKTTTNDDDTDLVVNNVPDGYRIVSIDIDGFINTVSNKIRKGDIVTPVCKVTEEYYDEETLSYESRTITYTPEDLTYLQVLTMTTGGGVDQEDLKPNEDGSYEACSTMVFCVTERQARSLILLNDKAIYFMLVTRDNEEKAKELLDYQDAVLADLDAKGVVPSMDDTKHGITYRYSDVEEPDVAKLPTEKTENKKENNTPSTEPTTEPTTEPATETETETTSEVQDTVTWFDYSQNSYHTITKNLFDQFYYGWIDSEGKQCGILIDDYNALTDEEKAVIDAYRGVVTPEPTTETEPTSDTEPTE